MTQFHQFHRVSAVVGRAGAVGTVFFGVASLESTARANAVRSNRQRMDPTWCFCHNYPNLKSPVWRNTMRGRNLRDTFKYDISQTKNKVNVRAVPLVKQFISFHFKLPYTRQTLPTPSIYEHIQVSSCSWTCSSSPRITDSCNLLALQCFHRNREPILPGDSCVVHLHSWGSSIRHHRGHWWVLLWWVPLWLALLWLGLQWAQGQPPAVVCGSKGHGSCHQIQHH